MYLENSAYFVPMAVSIGVSLTVLLIGSVTDLKTREVPDWINYGFILSGLGMNLLFSAIYSNIYFLLSSISGFVVFFAVAYIMFYTGQWGGGDSKMLMGLGSAIGIGISFKPPFFLLDFFVNAMVAGALYGILWSAFLALKNKKEFLIEFRRRLSQKETKRAKTVIFLILAFIAAILLSEWLFISARANIFTGKFLITAFASFSMLALITFYLWIFVKSIEKTCMYKSVSPKKLTEGDWIVNDIVLNKKIFLKKNSKELGAGNLRHIKNFIERTGKMRILDSKVKRKFLFFRLKTSISPKNLRASDILAQDLMYGDYICGPGDLGIEKSQIARLVRLFRQRKVGRILIKEGIPFVPSFLIAFVMTLIFGNLFGWVI